MFRTFLEVASEFNKRFGEKPILYGSFGLERVISKDLKAEDIDILISDELMQNQWKELQECMENLGFTLYDAKEREFIRKGIMIAFAPESDFKKLIKNF